MTEASPRFGAPRRHYRVCDSTNERLRHLALGDAPGGSVVTADEQSAGRGRQGRVWAAPAGKALLCSALLRPLDQRHALLPLTVPLAVCEAVESLAPVDCAVKWPNDVLIDGRKVAGVLIEARPQEGWAAIGIGLNLSIGRGEFPAEVRDRATSVGHGVDAGAALDRVCDALSGWVAAEPENALDDFRRRDALRGRRIEWADGAGIADGVDHQGNLLVVTDSGESLALGAGEVHLAPVEAY